MTEHTTNNTTRATANRTVPTATNPGEQPQEQHHDRGDDPSRVSEGVDLPVTYLRARASTWTFSDPNVKRWVESRLEGRVLNLFAGKTKLAHDNTVVRVDIDTDREADYHIDALHAREQFTDRSFDTVILDPPFSEIQSRKHYNGEYAGKFKHIRDVVKHLVKPGGKTLTFGYHSTGMATTRGFEKEELVLINHGGRFPDTVGSVDRRGENPRANDTAEQMYEHERDTIGVVERKQQTTLNAY